MLNILSVGKNCTGCLACKEICPQKAIEVGKDKFGFYYPSVIQTLCNNCGVCLKICHTVNCNPKIVDLLSVKKYYGWSLNESIRRRSSSGGIFTMITEAFSDPVIIGAEYVKSENIVKHTHGDISKLRRSKYVESYLGDVAGFIRVALNNGKKVIFCGTPCQVAGISKLFPKRNNLLLIDFICHGVPSMQFLVEHIKYIEQTINQKIDDINFRSKTIGWHQHGLLYYFENGTKKYISATEDSYFYGFNENIILRDCCYNCKYPLKSMADITLADFWGIGKFNFDIDDNKGISLFFVNTLAGETVFKKIKSCIYYEIIENNTLQYLSRKHVYIKGLKRRDKFIRKYKKVGFEKAMSPFLRKTRIRTKIKRLIGK